MRITFFSKRVFHFVVLTVAIISSTASAAEVQVPFSHGLGQWLYEENCSSCHGATLAGTDKGPPLVHDFYKPSHHNDQAFYRAALNGVKQHHWNFGDMPNIVGMTKKKMDRVIPFIRFYQREMKLY